MDIQNEEKRYKILIFYLSLHGKNYERPIDMMNHRHEIRTLLFWLAALMGMVLAPACQSPDGQAEALADKYQLLAMLSEQYEQKNLTEQQQNTQLEMLAEAQALGDSARQSEAHQRIATTYLVMGEMDQALSSMHEAYRLAPADSLPFRSQTLLMLCQVFLQNEEPDSACYYLQEAGRLYPPAMQTDLYRLSHSYVLAMQPDSAQRAEAQIGVDLEQSDLYTQAELLRLRLSLRQRRSAWHEAVEDADMLLALTDSISQIEASESMARIHALQHEQQMEHDRAEMASQRARHYLIIAVVLTLLLMASVAGWFYRRRAKIAHVHELEAMQLAESAQAGAEQLQKENRELQKLYYEHLYAIILPILNARRSKSGHINLEEDAWRQIEQNTDSVIPNFTTKLRRNHPSLSAEDVRFLCLVMMRVPNAIMADVYGIAPGSVSVKKQRMKHKLDDEMSKNPLETYLNQFLL